MKNKITLGLFALAITAIISSCSTSNDVASNKRIQKRKYNKGFFVSKNENVAFNKKKKDAKTVEFNTDTESIAKTDANSVKMEEISNNKSSIVEETAVITPNVETKTTEVLTTENNTVATQNEVVSESISEEQIKTVDLKNVKKTVNTVKKQSKKNSNGLNGLAIGTIILIILAIFIPPLAVLLFEGVTTRFWINLILYILLITALIAVIHALLIVTGTI